MRNAIAIASVVSVATAFPWVATQAGVDTSLLRNTKRQQVGGAKGGPATCPFNANHVPAVPFNPKYPYNSAQNGAAGKGIGGYYVPAKGDTAHYFVAPKSTDIRGPCPGLNAAANHGFLAHDGITTFNELVDAQQNLYNVGYDLALLLAALGLTLTDGDLVTEKLSIGCDATTRTSFSPALTGSEPGLDGHNKFEADTSLTRNDFFLGDGDNYSFNGTLFGEMNQVCNGLFDLKGLGAYRGKRYQESLNTNAEFFFGPLSLLLYGAASFLYELMPSGPNYIPDLPTISSFFGAQQNKNGTWSFNNKEQIPANWTTRLTPYTNEDVTAQIVAMYLEYPVLFGGNTAVGHFDGLSSFGSFIKNGSLSVAANGPSVSCLLYQLATSQIPSYLNGVITPTVAALEFIATKLGPQYANLGCPIPLTR